MDFSETELISEIKKRNEEAYRFMIKEYTKVIYYLAWRILQNVCTKEDLEECVSDVFLDIWLKIDELDQERGNFKTWILMLTKYKALKYRRRHTKHDVMSIDGAKRSSITKIA